jgi:predicted acetyltransferase
MSQVLKTQGYIASYNTPITEEIYEKLKYDPASISCPTQLIRAILTC